MPNGSPCPCALKRALDGASSRRELLALGVSWEVWMATLPLLLRNEHLFVETAGGLWLVDTGAPTSFGPALTVAGEQFRLRNSSLGLTAETLSEFVGVECVGLLGADVLGRFDTVLDLPNGRVTISTDQLAHGGVAVRLDEWMGIPIVGVAIRGVAYRMFLDTGAQVSYFQHETLTSFPAIGRVTDFYPGFGKFETETYAVDLRLGGFEFTLHCGQLPGLLGATLLVAGTHGVIGNHVVRDRQVGYFPRRSLLVL